MNESLKIIIEVIFRIAIGIGAFCGYQKSTMDSTWFIFVASIIILIWMIYPVLEDFFGWIRGEK